MAEIVVDATVFKEIFARLRQQNAERILQQVTPIVRRQLLAAEREIKEKLSNDVLKVRSGTLRASVGIQPPHLEGERIVARVGVLKPTAAQKYAGIQLRGGTIRAKSGKFLAIPLAAARTPAGVPRYASPLRETLAAAFPGGTFVAKGVLFGKKGKGERAKIIPLFVLKRSVTIPPHDYLSGPRTTLLHNTQLLLSQAVAKEILAR